MAQKRFTDADYAEMAAMREDGTIIAAIAAKFACSIGLVAWTCLRLGADAPGAYKSITRDAQPLIIRNGHPTRGYNPEQDAIILEMEARGESLSAIGRRLGRKHNSIKGRLMTLARREARAELRAEEAA